MIVRKEADGGIMILTQMDHSRLAGFLAAHWGNDTFTAVQPYESVTRAATFHDFGWLRYETSPEVNPSNGEPYTFVTLPFSQGQLDAYQWCVDWLAGVDRYAALLVGMHRVGLWKSRYQTITYPAWRYADVELPPAVHDFIARSEPIQEHERQAIGGDTIWTNYRLLQVWDLLGLYFTTGEPYEHAVEPVPTAYDGDRRSGVRISLHPLGTGRVAFDPYPFDTRPLDLHVPFRRLDRVRFESAEDFRKAYFQAVPELLTCTVE
jgi:hypothetical protein